jgi:hypothetical protein
MNNLSKIEKEIIEYLIECDTINVDEDKASSGCMSKKQVVKLRLSFISC